MPNGTKGRRPWFSPKVRPVLMALEELKRQEEQEEHGFR